MYQGMLQTKINPQCNKILLKIRTQYLDMSLFLIFHFNKCKGGLIGITRNRINITWCSLNHIEPKFSKLCKVNYTISKAYPDGTKVHFQRIMILIRGLKIYI